MKHVRGERESNAAREIYEMVRTGMNVCRK